MKRARPQVRPARVRPGTSPRVWPHTLPGRLAALLAAAAACWAVLAFGVQYVRTYTLAREATRLERYGRDLLVQNASLLAEITRLRTDDQYLERLAREQLGMLRPGELELVIVPLTTTTRHSERDAVREVAAPPPDRLDSANALLQHVTGIVRGLMKTVRAAAEHALERWHLGSP
jgi:cell division protein FtsB